MKISISFEELNSILGYSNTILSDKSVEDKMKNVIFLVTKETVKLVAYNAFTFSRTVFENAEIDLGDKESWSFQIKATELNKIVSSFSSLYRTEVKRLDFEEDGVRIKLVVHEEPKENCDERLAQDSVFQLENAPIVKKVEEEIMMEFPEGADYITAADLLLYLDPLSPLVSNDSANGIGSKIYFAEDYVFVINSSLVAFMENRLPDAFKNLSVTFSSASFLKKVAESASNIGVAKVDKYLCIQEGNTEAFMKYMRVSVNYKPYVDKRSKDKGIVIDRLYLKDVLKRMSNTDANGKIQITDAGELHVSNNNFQQDIPLNNIKNAEGVSFNISVPILEKIILGKDDVFSSEIFMYFVDTARGYLVYMSDKTGVWFTNMQVVKA